MISSKSLISLAAAVGVVSSIGIVYAQTTAPTTDNTRTENAALPVNQPGSMGTSTMPMGSTAVVPTPGDATRSSDTTLPANQPAAAGTMGTQGSTSTGTMPMNSSSGDPRTNNNMSNSDMSRNMGTATGEPSARADRN